MDFGRGLGGLAGDFGDILVHGWNSKNRWFSLGFSWFWRLEGVLVGSSGRLGAYVGRCWAQDGSKKE